ncbi:hypothetical protein NP493_8123g00000 [Ridgeia piscesae]|uniref:Secreted protein n=1 Tax=Ridgeia piscesae TaxID=27915 RepID=A0AAD9MNM1_RIDPI|nr:hypothetical protein NP493_8123g00000 [Ridgeia piscesae]
MTLLSGLWSLCHCTVTTTALTTGSQSVGGIVGSSSSVLVDRRRRPSFFRRLIVVVVRLGSLVRRVGGRKTALTLEDMRDMPLRLDKSAEWL